ncbi:MAG: molecular chaperone HtpG [Spirochaetales bacterium]|nr:molecular chaperone HtpG [Spirochaetales bacterium]
MAKQKFKTEVNQLLDLLIHSLYSHPEIFLRELVSNSSDAMDKLKYLTLTDDNFKNLEFDPRIDIEIDEVNHKTLKISDSGIGMNKDDLVDSLGTIARSGTKNFLSNLTGDAKKDSNLIGQFGVGFYSIFMVADKAEVITKKAGEDQAWKWTSDGKTGFSITEAEKEGHGTDVILHLNDQGRELDSQYEIKNITKKYSNHIAFPIFLHYEKTEWEGEGDDRTSKQVPTTEQINSASALWRRNKSEISEEEYNEFYKSVADAWDEPMMTVHTKAEGTMEYTTLFYVPKTAPMDMFQADYKPGVKLYVRRVFITDDDKELMPTYLRFVKGVIDSEDLPLNVSRELLQKNKVLAGIKTASTKKMLSEFKKLSQDKEKYSEFIDQYNRPLKEGLYSDFSNKEALMELVRFKSTTEEGWVSLAEYKERMKDDQKAIYYIAGEREEQLRKSPLLEAYAKKGIEVLVMADEIDDMVMPMAGPYQEIELKAINKSNAADDLKDEEDEKKEKATEPVAKKIKEALGEAVKDVKVSSRLHESPCCIVADENDPSAQMRQMMAAMGQAGNLPELQPILEINPDHEMVTKLASTEDKQVIEDVSWVLLNQAMLLEGHELKDASDFAARLNRLVGGAL